MSSDTGTSIADIAIKSAQVLLRWGVPSTAIMGASVGLTGLLAGSSDKINEIILLADQVVVEVSGQVDFAPLALGNYLFPLDQLLSYVGVYLLLLGICALIRMIKSWIPTVS